MWPAAGINSVKTAFRFLTASLAALGLSAQVLPSDPVPMFWGPAGELIRHASGALRVEAPPSRPTLARVIPLAPDLEHVHVEGGWFWANRKVRRPGGLEIHVLRSENGSQWHFVARWVPGKGQPVCRILALGPDFLATSAMAPFQHGERQSRAAVLAQGRGDALHVKRLVDLGSKHTPQGIFVPWVVAVPDGWALVHFRTGHLWTVRAVGDHIQDRAFKLLASVPDRALAGNMDLEVAVLGCQPSPTGELLIATRSGEAVIKGREWAKALNPELGRPTWIDPSIMKDPRPQSREMFDRALEAYGKRQDAIEAEVAPKVLEAFPDLLWWELDVREGSLRRREPPPGAPTRIGSVEVLKAFRFRFAVDGNLIMGE